MRVHLWIAAALLLAVSTAAFAELKVVGTFPAAGAKEVDPTIAKIRVRFSAPVRTDSYAFCGSSEGEQPKSAGKPVFEEGGLVCVWPVTLRPGVTYSIGINSPDFKGFRSATDMNVSATPYVLTFTTSNKKNDGKTPAQRWHEDLACLAEELPAKHKNLFFKLTKEEFREQVEALDKQIPKLSEEQITVELMKLVASVGDGHTGVRLSDPLTTTVLPMIFYQFKDGLYITAAEEKYGVALGGRVVRIGEMDVESACKAISVVIPHENDAWVKSAAPNLLQCPRILAALGIIADAKHATFELVTREGRELCIDVAAVPKANHGNIIQAVDYTKEPIPLRFRKPDSSYWVDYLASENTVYVKYNRCRDSAGYPVSQLSADTEKLLKEHETARLVIDLSQNGGGNSNLLDPLIKSLAGMPRFQRKGQLFAIIGRHTFSSGVLNAIDLRDDAKAILVGEPTGGKPNCYGEVLFFQLPNSGLTVTYSTKFFQLSAVDTPSLMPEIPAESGFQDFVAGIDPSMDAILKYAPEK